MCQVLVLDLASDRLETKTFAKRMENVFLEHDKSQDCQSKIDISIRIK